MHNKRFYGNALMACLIKLPSNWGGKWQDIFFVVEIPQYLSLLFTCQLTQNFTEAAVLTFCLLLYSSILWLLSLTCLCHSMIFPQYDADL